MLDSSAYVLTTSCCVNHLAWKKRAAVCCCNVEDRGVMRRHWTMSQRVSVGWNVLCVLQGFATPDELQIFAQPLVAKEIPKMLQTTRASGSPIHMIAP